MLLSELSRLLSDLSEIVFIATDGSVVPAHFHITEVGRVDRYFIDCGGAKRTQTKINLQLWTALDYDHRLAPQKMREIISMAQTTLDLPDAEVEVSYQWETIGLYDLAFAQGKFYLMPQFTTCLASDHCGIKPEQMPAAQKPRVKISELNSGGCLPGSGCC